MLVSAVLKDPKAVHGFLNPGVKYVPGGMGADSVVVTVVDQMALYRAVLTAEANRTGSAAALILTDAACVVWSSATTKNAEGQKPEWTARITHTFNSLVNNPAVNTRVSIVLASAAVARWYYAAYRVQFDEALDDGGVGHLMAADPSFTIRRFPAPVAADGRQRLPLVSHYHPSAGCGALVALGRAVALGVLRSDAALNLRAPGATDALTAAVAVSRLSNHAFATAASLLAPATLSALLRPPADAGAPPPPAAGAAAPPPPPAAPAGLSDDLADVAVLLLTATALEDRRGVVSFGPLFGTLSTPAAARSAAAQLDGVLRRLRTRQAAHARSVRVQVALAIVRSCHAYLRPIADVQSWARKSRANARLVRVLGVGGLVEAIALKAREYGRLLLTGKEHWSTQTCQFCWAIGPAAGRKKACRMCGATGDRDCNGTGAAVTMTVVYGAQVAAGIGWAVNP